MTRRVASSILASERRVIAVNVDLVEAALGYLEQGFSVVPVRGKQPLGRWQAFQAARMNALEARREFSRPESTGIALVCGTVSGLMVLDFDGATGRDAFEVLTERGFIDDAQPVVLTGSGGHHVYYSLEGWARTSVWTWRGSRAGELRVDGSYVLAPPSLHPNGERYVWDTGLTGSRLPLMNGDLRAVLRSISGSQITPERRENIVPAAEGRVSARVLLEKAEREARGIGRNNAGFRLARWLRDNGYTRDEAHGVMLEFAGQVREGGASHLYNEREALASLHSAFSRAPRAPWGAAGSRGVN